MHKGINAIFTVELYTGAWYYRLYCCAQTWSHFKQLWRCSISKGKLQLGLPSAWTKALKHHFWNKLFPCIFFTLMALHYGHKDALIFLDVIVQIISRSIIIHDEENPASPPTSLTVVLWLNVLLKYCKIFRKTFSSKPFGSFKTRCIILQPSVNYSTHKRFWNST